MTRVTVRTRNPSVQTANPGASSIDAATQSQVNTGTATGVYVSPKTLAEKVEVITASGTDTYTATIPGTLTSGRRVYVLFTNANTGASTLNGTEIKKSVNTALSSGDIAAGEVKLLAYDGTNFQVVGGSGSATPSINVEGGVERKITDMTALADTSVASGDLLPIVDVSDTTDAATGTNKKLSFSGVFPPTILKISTRRHGNQPTNDTLGTLALTINSLRSSYMVINEYCSIDLIGMQITSGASGNMWVAIYDVNMATGKPTNLIGWSGVLSAATGVREGWTLVASSNVLKPGVYALAYLTDTGNTARSISSIIYSTYFLGLTSAYGASFGSGWNVALTYTDIPPNPFTSGGAIAESSVNLPYIGCRLS